VAGTTAAEDDGRGGGGFGGGGGGDGFGVDTGSESNGGEAGGGWDQLPALVKEGISGGWLVEPTEVKLGGAESIMPPTFPPTSDPRFVSSAAFHDGGVRVKLTAQIESVGLVFKFEELTAGAFNTG
jgi:hypothetical protein